MTEEETSKRIETERSETEGISSDGERHKTGLEAAFETSFVGSVHSPERYSLQTRRHREKDPVKSGGDRSGGQGEEENSPTSSGR